MQTQSTPETYQHTSPAGAEVRLLMNNEQGGMAHCTLKANTVSRAVRHHTVSEFWYVLSGSGAIWRRENNEEQISTLTPGVSIDIPLGCDFQYRSDNADLVFICVTLPPWPGADEASYVKKGAWAPTVK